MRNLLFGAAFLFIAATATALDTVPLLKGVTVDETTLDTTKHIVTVKVTLPAAMTLDEAALDEMSRVFVSFFAQTKTPFKSLVILARKSGGTVWRDIRQFLPQLPPVPQKSYEPAAPKPRIGFPRSAPTGSGGALAGKTVYLSAGHGWYDTGSDWTTQRGNTEGIVEDLSNSEIISYFLAPMLRNAGALVLTVRETDRTAASVTVDDTDGGYTESEGWWESASAGWGRLTTPLATGDEPFAAGHYRVTTPAAGRWARWAPTIPVDGRYQVSVSFRAMDDRAPTARYEVRHAGGVETVTVDQRHHGATWFPLGEFPFRAGLDATAGSVTLIADTTAGGTYAIADAVRFGGGAGAIDRGNGVSGKPQWEEAGRYYAQLLGAPATVYDTSSGDNSDDVTTRSRWAAWENEAAWDDALFISWHSNAYNGSSRGTSTYVYGLNDPGTGWEPAAQTGSESLATLLHNGVIAALQAGWDAAWPEHGLGLYSAWFGELNPSYNNEMPACLIELAFHDNTIDSNALRDPRFRTIAARASVQAVIQYFADRDAFTALYPPDTPRAVQAITVNATTGALSWEEPLTTPRNLHGDAATGYLIQRSSDGFAFDGGEDIGDTLTYSVGLLYGVPAYFRVVAYNDGGRSFPSSVVALSPATAGAQVLIVDGFERLDRNQQVAQDLSADGLGTVMRMVVERMNTFDYVRAHADALTALTYSFDTVEKSALSAIDLSVYDAVLWFAGEQSTANGTIAPAEQTQLCDYLDGGGLFFISGSEYGWDLYDQGDTADQTFFTDCLGLSYLGDDGASYDAATTATGSAVFDGSLSFDDGTYIYNVDYPDLIGAAGDGVTFLGYGDGTGGGAGVVTGGTRKVAALGFPFETILDADTRTALLAGIFDWYSLSPVEEPVDEDTVDDDSVVESDSGDEGDLSDDMVDEDILVSDLPDLSDAEGSDELVVDEDTIVSDLSDGSESSDETMVDEDHVIVSDDDYESYESDMSYESDLTDDTVTDEQTDTDTAKGSNGGCGCSLI